MVPTEGQKTELKKALAAVEAQREKIKGTAAEAEIAVRLDEISAAIKAVMKGTLSAVDLTNLIKEKTGQIAVIKKGGNADGGKDPAAEASDLNDANKLWLSETILTPQYAGSAAITFEFLDASKGEAVPTETALMAAMLKTLTNEQVDYFKRMRKPTLHIVPDTTADRLISGINKPCFKTREGAATSKHPYGQPQPDAIIDDFYENALSGVATMNGVPENQDKITSYHFVICEGDTAAHGAVKGDHDYEWNRAVSVSNEDRIAAFEIAQKPAGVKSMNAAGYIIAMARSLARKEPINGKTYNILCGEPKYEHVKDGRVACGGWNGKVYLDYADLGAGGADARLCASVMGKIA